MFIVDFFKTMSAVKKAKKFINAHEETVEKIKGLIANVQESINWFEEHKAEIQTKIEIAKTTLMKLKGYINK